MKSTCTRINTSARRRTRPSAGPERSQLLQILPSLTVRQFFSVSTYFSCCVNIGRHLIFPVHQCFCRRQYFSMHQGFSIRQGFWMRNVFVYDKVFGCANVFVSAKVFGCANFFYIIAGAYIFVYFSAILFSMRQ